MIRGFISETYCPTRNFSPLPSGPFSAERSARGSTVVTEILTAGTSLRPDGYVSIASQV